MRLKALFAAAGAALAYFFDPDGGNRRRKMARDRVAALFRRSGKRVERAGRSVAADARGLAAKAAHVREEQKPQPNDAALVQKVESEAFREADMPKGRVSVNAENGVVFLRGEVDSPDLVQRLEEAVRSVQGVRGVENLLHAPGEPAPQKQ